MLLLHFLRLVRFGNLMVIGVTMCIIQAFIAFHTDNPNALDKVLVYTEGSELTFNQRWLAPINFNLDFLLLILSVILIAGAGNIINDYFDIKADRVNKPEKMVIEKHIKRRWAIVWNWVFNSVGFLISIYLSWQYQNIWIAIVALITINFLWFYSALYKRKIFVGNILVALLVGLVPIYVLIYNLPISGFEVTVYAKNHSSFEVDLGNFFVVKVVLTIAIIAFVINLMREIIKDMADIRGDLHIDASTVPISLGIRRTKLILILMLIPLLMFMAFYIYDIHATNTLYAYETKGLFLNLRWFILFVVLSGSLCVLSFAFLLSSNTRKRYLLSSNLLKLAMLFGIVSPLFL